MRAWENLSPPEPSPTDEAVDSMIEHLSSRAGLQEEMRTGGDLADTLCQIVAFAVDPDSERRTKNLMEFCRMIRSDVDRRKNAMYRRAA